MTGTYQHPLTFAQYAHPMDTSHDGVWQRFGLYTMEEGMIVCERNRATQQFGVNHLELAITGANATEIELEILDDVGTDEHNNVVTKHDSLGHWHVWPLHHDDPLHYLRTVDAEDGLAGGLEPGPELPDIGPTVSYPGPCAFSDGTIIVTFRDIGGAGRGDRAMWKLDAGETEWGPRVLLAKGLPSGAPEAEDDINFSVYFNFPFVERVTQPHPDRAWLPMVWRQRGGEPYSNIRIGLVRSDDKMTTFKNVQGGSVDAPLDADDTSFQLGYGPDGTGDIDTDGFVNNPTVAIDHLGHPHVCINEDTLFTIGPLQVFHWDGDEWLPEEIPETIGGISRTGRINPIWHRNRLMFFAPGSPDAFPYEIHYPYLFDPDKDRAYQVGTRIDGPGPEIVYDDGARFWLGRYEIPMPTANIPRMVTAALRARAR